MTARQKPSIKELAEFGIIKVGTRIYSPIDCRLGKFVAEVTEDHKLRIIIPPNFDNHHFNSFNHCHDRITANRRTNVWLWWCIGSNRGKRINEWRRRHRIQLRQ